MNSLFSTHETNMKKKTKQKVFYIVHHYNFQKDIHDRN